MLLELLYKRINNKYYKICVLTIGFSYIALKSQIIQKYVRYFARKWMFQNNPTYVVSSISESAFVVEQLRRRLYKKRLLGLDCEWVSTKGRRHPVALLQLAAPDGFCSLFRLSSLKRIPEELADLLQDRSVIKVGVAVVADARYLSVDYGVNCEGCLDLRHLAKTVGLESRGLANLANEIFGIELDKNWRIRCSDWEAETLSQTQIQYASQDACVAVDIFNVLNHKQICKQYSIWKRLFWTEKEYWKHSVDIWSPYMGLNFRDRAKGSNSNQAQNVRGPKAPITTIKRNYNTLLQKTHYSNIFLLAPDDQVLCTISESRAAWYLEKELADVVCEDPKTLRLKFEPARRSNEPNGYYTRPKDNKCVVCGCETDLRRKNVVPSEYRRYFEDKLKKHHSHDVLLLCLSCHTRSNMADQVLREKLVEECNAPLSGGKYSKMVDMPDLRALRNAARALYYSGDVIPQERKAHLQKVICDKLGVSSNQITSAYLENIINIDCTIESDKYVPHGQKVVEQYLSQGGVEELERRWRQHFLDTLRPRYLPQLWSVSYVRD